MNWSQMNEDLSFRKLINSSEYPETLKYDFNKNGELRHMDTNEPFIYNYQNSHNANHQHYQCLGYLINQYVYDLLETTCKLRKVYFPTDAQDNELCSFFFMSENALTNCSTLVILLQDKGPFRAGQWGRKAIVREGLRDGSQIPFILKALQCCWGVIVLNPNDNFIELKMEQECLSISEKKDSTRPLQSPLAVPKRESSSPEEHTRYIWDHFISKSTAEKVVFIAHGYGGLLFINLLMQRTSEVMNKVAAVALIDSTHHTSHQTQGISHMQAWIWKHCREWVSHSEPLDQPVGFMRKADCPAVSAGTEKYSLAPSSSLQSIFRYLKSALKVFTEQPFSRSPVLTRRKSMKTS